MQLGRRVLWRLKVKRRQPVASLVPHHTVSWCQGRWPRSKTLAQSDQRHRTAQTTRHTWHWHFPGPTTGRLQKYHNYVLLDRTLSYIFAISPLLTSVTCILAATSAVIQFRIKCISVYNLNILTLFNLFITELNVDIFEDTFLCLVLKMY